MLTMSLPQPPTITTGYRWLDKPIRLITAIYWLLVQIPLHGIKVFPPIFLLALSASYASAQFAAHHNVFTYPLNWAQAIAFEWVYIGALAMAQQRGRWFFAVLIAGALTSIVYITLYAADQYALMGQVKALMPANWFPLFRLVITFGLVLAHSVPLTTVNIVYGFLIHSHLRDLAQRENECQLREKFTCPFGCGASFLSEPALRGHKAHCPAKA